MAIGQHGDRNDEWDPDAFGHTARLAIRAGRSSQVGAEKAGHTIIVSAVGAVVDRQRGRGGAGTPNRVEVIGRDGDVLDVPSGRRRVVLAVKGVTRDAEANYDRPARILRDVDHACAAEIVSPGTDRREGIPAVD